MAATGGFVPPPYPYERLDALKRLADSLPGGVVDCSIGTPCDPVPEVAMRAATGALTASNGYPPSAGTVALRDAAAGWIGRRFGVDVEPAHVGACVGTKELVASLPHLLRLRNPGRDTVLYPAIAYPSYEMGAVLGGCRAVPVPLDAQWHLDLDAISDADAARALVLWINEPGNPSASTTDDAYFARVAAWARERGVVVASDECYAEFAPRPATILSSGLDGVLAMHSVSKRSNLAGMRVGFYAGDPDLVTYLVETRKHAGLMAPTMVQAAATAALGDDAHVDVQRARYVERRELLRSTRSRPTASSTTVATRRSISGCAPPTVPTTAGRSRPGSRTKRACSCRPAISTVRSAPITCVSRSCSHTSAWSSRLDRLVARPSLNPELRSAVDHAKQVTQLFEAGDEWRDVMALAEARELVGSVIGMLDRGEIRVAEVIDGKVVVNESAKHAILMWFRVQEMKVIEAGPFEYVDKLPLEARLRGRGCARGAGCVGALRRIPRAAAW